MRTSDVKFIDLCDEIDYWKEKCKKAEADAEYWRGCYADHLHESIKSAEQGVAKALMFALHATDDANGNLIITPESRIELKESFEKIDKKS
jgi:hypothetical protein